MIKSSLALAIEQLLLLDPFCELHFDVALSFVSLSLFPLLLSVVIFVVAVFVHVVSAAETGGGEVCLGASKELKGTSGITKFSSLTVTGLLTTNAPTLIVSLRDFEVSSLKYKQKININLKN